MYVAKNNAIQDLYAIDKLCNVSIFLSRMCSVPKRRISDLNFIYEDAYVLYGTKYVSLLFQVGYPPTAAAKYGS